MKGKENEMQKSSKTLQQLTGKARYEGMFFWEASVHDICATCAGHLNAVTDGAHNRAVMVIPKENARCHAAKKTPRVWLKEKGAQGLDPSKILRR